MRRSTGTAFGANETWSTTAYSGNIGTFFADIDGDGRADAIAIGSSNIVVRRSTGTAFGSTESWTFDPFFGNVATYIADVDGDGRADAIAVNASGITVRRSGAVAGWFPEFGSNEAWTVTPFTGNTATVFADVTGDHKADAIAVDTSAGTTVRRSLRSRAP